MSDEHAVTEDQAIASYRRALEREADVAREDLDEVEDHLRALTSELRASGLPATTAVAEAARRLGEPRAVAREHARVRGGFGVPLSRTRAWSAAALLAFPPSYLAIRFVSGGADPLVYLELALTLVLLGALAARLTWARAIALGSLPLLVLSAAITATAGSAPMTAIHAAVFACNAGGLLFVLPWRRREVSGAGYALAVMGPLYTAATAAFVLTSWPYSADGPVFDHEAATLGLACTVAAAAGGVLRARWSAVLALCAMGAVGFASKMLADSSIWLENEHLWRADLVGTQVVGAACALAAAVLVWRTGRSRLGELRYLAR